MSSRNKIHKDIYGSAEFFKSLGCANALFLDGDLSMMVINPKGRIKDGNPLGAIIAISEGKN